MILFEVKAIYKNIGVMFCHELDHLDGIVYTEKMERCRPPSRTRILKGSAFQMM